MDGAETLGGEEVEGYVVELAVDLPDWSTMVEPLEDWQRGREEHTIRPWTAPQTYVATELTRQNRLWRRKGSLVKKPSQRKAQASPTTPTTRGTSVWTLFQGCCVPPHEIATRKRVAEEVKMKLPVQSTLASFWPMVAVRGLSVRRRGMLIRPNPQKGSIMMKTQRQVVSWTNAPPNTGPMQLPKAHAPSLQSKRDGQRKL